MYESFPVWAQDFLRDNLSVARTAYDVIGWVFALYAVLTSWGTLLAVRTGWRINKWLVRNPGAWLYNKTAGAWLEARRDRHFADKVREAEALARLIRSITRKAVEEFTSPQGAMETHAAQAE